MARKVAKKAAKKAAKRKAGGTSAVGSKRAPDKARKNAKASKNGKASTVKTPTSDTAAKKQERKKVKKAVKRTAAKTATRRTAAKAIENNGTAGRSAAKPGKRAVKTRPGAGATSVAKAARARKTAVDSAQSRVASSTAAQTVASEAVEAPVQTHLTDKQLQEFRQLLLRKRAEMTHDVTQLTNEALRRNHAGPEHSSAMPIHLADRGTDNWEQEFTLGLIANERGVVREIDDALQRIDNRTYGVCIATGKKIRIARLRAKPWAKYCIEYARAKEEGRVF